MILTCSKKLQIGLGTLFVRELVMNINVKPVMRESKHIELHSNSYVMYVHLLGLYAR